MDRFKGKITMMPKNGIEEIVRNRSFDNQTKKTITKATTDVEKNSYGVYNYEIPSINQGPEEN